jgi:RHS repeat-associated protein
MENICAPNDDLETVSLYDYHDRLTGVTVRPSGGSTITAEATYTYDALGRRIGVSDFVSGGSTTAIWTVYDGQEPYTDFGPSGGLLQRHLYGPTMDAILARTSSGGTSAWYLTDHLGTVRDIANSSGAVTDHISYDSFGNILSESNAANGDRFKFAGREYDSATGQYYNRARYYSPAVGRFLSRDTKGFFAGDPNLYRYTNNGPANATDPSGFQAQPNDQGSQVGQAAAQAVTLTQYVNIKDIEKAQADAEQAHLVAIKYELMTMDPLGDNYNEKSAQAARARMQETLAVLKAQDAQAREHLNELLDRYVTEEAQAKWDAWARAAYDKIETLQRYINELGERIRDELQIGPPPFQVQPAPPMPKQPAPPGGLEGSGMKQGPNTVPISPIGVPNK